MARNVMALRALAALLLMVGSASTQALGMDYTYDSFKTADAVTSVQMCGRWGKDQPGTFRVVHAERYAQSFLYVQWMARTANGSLYAEHTVSITEMNNDHAEISLDKITCRARGSGIVLTAPATSGHDDKLRSVTIDVGPAPGQYRYRAHRAR